MANGTIAFDTLSTSGQISGTAVSIDTDFLAHGSAKSWVNHTDAAVLTDSFNISTGTDNSTGNYDLTFANPMANRTYSPAATTLHAQINSIGQDDADRATTFYQVIIFARDDTLTAVNKRGFSQIFGDLA